MTPTHRPLAGAYLALADDPAPSTDQRSLPRVMTALLVAATIAVAAPLAWATSVPGKPPADPPQATTTGKASALPADDDAS